MNSAIVVGGGVIGMLSALELYRNGFKVTIIDRQSFGQESSWAGGGIISPLFPWRYPDPITELARLSQELYPQLVEELHQAGTVDPEFLHSGMLVLGGYEDENPTAWADRLDIDMHSVDRPQISALAPELAPAHEQGFWFPSIHQVRNPRLVAALKQHLQRNRIEMVEDQAVTKILTHNGGVSGARTTAQDYHADAVVVAGGAWSSSILSEFPLTTVIRPIKGQMLLIKAEQDCVTRITLSDDRYLIPRRDGRVLVGSTTEDTGFDKSTDSSVRDALWHYAIDTVPALAGYPIEHHWSGLRPGSLDGLPVIGAHPDVDGLFVNTGHYRNGLVMAPASARLLTEIMTSQPPSLNPADYALSDRIHTTPVQTDRLSRQT